MKNIGIILLLLSGLLVQFVGAQDTEQDLLEKLITDFQTVGATAGYSINGETVWSGAVGYSDQANNLPFEVTNLTRIASITKPMTAVAIMQLVQAGKIELDLPIQTYLPSFPKSKKGMITTKQLLSHTSGIDGYKNSKETESKTIFENLPDAVEVFAERKLKFKPGSDFYYTTYGYVILGLIIEQVSGMSYEEYMQTNIWDKAGMTHTGIEKYNKEYQNKSELYHYRKGKVKKGEKNSLSNRVPGGGVYSTLDDMIKFGNAILNNTLVSEEVLVEMTKKYSLEKEGNPYGLGWYMYAQAPVQHMVIGHSGEQTGCAAQMMINRKNNVVVVVLTNTSGTWEHVIGATAQLMNIAGARVDAE